MATSMWAIAHQRLSEWGSGRCRPVLAVDAGRGCAADHRPIEFDLQWDDEHIPREGGLALFDAFASTEKSLHVNAGKHMELPRFEAASAVRFFERHLRG